MNEQINNNEQWQCRQKKNTANLAKWTVAWLLTLALATFSPQFDWGESTTLTLLAILLNMAVGFGMIIANKKYLKNADEMQQKIMLESMAITLGMGLVLGLSYSLLDITNIIGVDAQISNLIMIMGITNIVSTVLIKRRYQ